MTKKVGVIGAGSWGTAISKMLAEKGYEVCLWCHEREVADGINQNHQNPVYLQDIVLPKAVEATNSLALAVEDKEVVVSVVPSHHVRTIWQEAAEYLKPEAILVSATKGIELKSHKLMSQVLKEVLPHHLPANRVYISGPSFAPEVVRNLPASVVIAGEDVRVREKIREFFRTDTFLPFSNEDVTGVEVGGAIKNVIAIATGMSDGLGFGHNARAAIITRGLYEMVKIGKALGANPLTFMGLAGIGDLVLTCTADLSRNHTVGKLLGEGKKLEEILAGMTMVAEGIPTAEAIYHLAANHKINAPICNVVYLMLYEDLTPREAATWLCSRPLEEELRSIL
ncbi:MAG: NAD(P)H-dependent glycerol-3-phosphate dehydrogenase [Pseudomonadota bacterium]